MRESFDGFMSGKRPLTEVKEEGTESHDDDGSRKLSEADYGRACELSRSFSPLRVVLWSLEQPK